MTPLPFDDQKMAALDAFIREYQKRFPSPNHADLEELEVSFLEQCDLILLENLALYFDTSWLEEFGDEELRHTLTTQITPFSSYDDESEEAVPDDALLGECFDLLERLEDVSESWLSVFLFSPDRLNALYQDLSRSKFTSLREHFFDLLVYSPLFIEEDLLRLRLTMIHLEEGPLLVLMKRFLEAQLAYGDHLQQRCLVLHLEFVQQIRRAFTEQTMAFLSQV